VRPSRQMMKSVILRGTLSSLSTFFMEVFLRPVSRFFFLMHFRLLEIAFDRVFDLTFLLAESVCSKRVVPLFFRTFLRLEYRLCCGPSAGEPVQCRPTADLPAPRRSSLRRGARLSLSGQGSHFPICGFSGGGSLLWVFARCPPHVRPDKGSGDFLTP